MTDQEKLIYKSMSACHKGQVNLPIYLDVMSERNIYSMVVYGLGREKVSSKKGNVVQVPTGDNCISLVPAMLPFVEEIRAGLSRRVLQNTGLHCPSNVELQYATLFVCWPPYQHQ